MAAIEASVGADAVTSLAKGALFGAYNSMKHPEVLAAACGATWRATGGAAGGTEGREPGSLAPAG